VLALDARLNDDVECLNDGQAAATSGITHIKAEGSHGGVTEASGGGLFSVFQG